MTLDETDGVNAIADRVRNWQAIARLIGTMPPEHVDSHDARRAFEEIAFGLDDIACGLGALAKPGDAA